MTNKPKIILLNAPKEAGKNELLKFYMNYHSVEWNDLMRGESNEHLWFDASCKVHLYKLVQDFFLVSEQRFWEIYNDRELKEKPLPEFRVQFNSVHEYMSFKSALGIRLQGSHYGGKRDIQDVLIQPLGQLSKETRVMNLSIREAMIYLSECVMKVLFGNDCFGKARMSLIKQNPSQIYYDDSSSCFNGDSSELNGLVDHFGEDNILLIRIKGRGTFEGDSRSYHPDGVVKNTVDLWNDKDEDSFLEAGSKIIEEFLTKSS